ncbi:MAG: DUF2065 domain-containing protein [Sphingomonadales bacterium]
MTDFLVAMGLILVIEGALYALFPEGMKRMMVMALTQPVNALRLSGLIAAVVGVAVVWAVRG